MECYYLSYPIEETGKPNRDYRQRMHRQWKESGIFETTEQQICEQARAIRKNGWLTEVELELIKRRVLEVETDRAEASGETGEPRDIEKEETSDEGDSEEVIGQMLLMVKI